MTDIRPITPLLEDGEIEDALHCAQRNVLEALAATGIRDETLTDEQEEILDESCQLMYVSALTSRGIPFDVAIESLDRDYEWEMRVVNDELSVTARFTDGDES